MTSHPPAAVADLVLGGGGVKGVALVGAVAGLVDAGYTIARVAGSSAGAVVGCLVAGLRHAGEPLSRLEEIYRTLDLRRLRDAGPLGRVPLVGPAWSVLVHDGLYRGRYLERLLEGTLADLGVRTFGDLRISRSADPGSALPAAQSYGLVVTATDLSRRRLARLPWDYGSYGLDPDEQSVAQAVQASAAIPYVFRPARRATPTGVVTLVDGSLLSDYPIGMFDRADSLEPRWPTFGVRLRTPPETPPVTHPVRGPLSLGLNLLETLLTDQDSAYVEQPCTRARTIFVDTFGVSGIDFTLDAATAARLSGSGRTATARFLQTWDFPQYVAGCRSAAATGRAAIPGV